MCLLIYVALLHCFQKCAVTPTLSDAVVYLQVCGKDAFDTHCQPNSHRVSLCRLLKRYSLFFFNQISDLHKKVHRTDLKLLVRTFRRLYAHGKTLLSACTSN